MKDDTLAQSLENIDLPALVLELYPESRAKPGRAGTYFATWRNNHNSPSFSIYRNPGNPVWFFKDKATDETGTAFHFLTRIHGLSDLEAADFLHDRAGVPRPERRDKKMNTPTPSRAPENDTKNTPKSATGTALRDATVQLFNQMLDRGQHTPKALAGRGFKQGDMDDLMIVDDGGDALIPFYSPTGELVNIKRRFAEPKNKMRYISEPGRKGSPFYEEGAQHAAVPWISDNITSAKTVFIIEGELNAMIAWSVMREYDGGPVAFMGLPGSEGKLYLEQLEGKRVYVYADDDAPGKKARERWLAEAKLAGASSGYRVLSWAGEKDFCDLAGEGRLPFYDALAAAIKTAEEVWSPLDMQIATYTVRELREIAKRLISGEIAVPTGFKELDLFTHGLPTAGIALVCALPSIGKSAFIRAVFEHNLEADPNKKVMLFSPDQSVPEVMILLAAKLSGVPFWRVQNNSYTPEMLEHFGSPEKVKRHFGEVFDHCLLHLSKRFLISEVNEADEVFPAIERALDRGVSMFGFDYLQIFEATDERGRPIENKVLSLFKKRVDTWKVPLLFATQLAKSKYPSTRKSGFPMISDIEGHGIAAQAANQVYMLYNQDIYMRDFRIQRDEYADYSSVDEGKVRVFVEKNKMGKKNDYRYLCWDPEYATMRELGHPRAMELAEARRKRGIG